MGKSKKINPEGGSFKSLEYIILKQNKTEVSDYQRKE